MFDKINYKISTIAEEICNKKETHLLSKDTGLYTGKWGVLLFLAYYSKYTNDKKFKNIYYAYANSCIDELASTFTPSFSFCDGICGVLFTLHHLKETSLLDIDLDEAESYFDDFLIVQIQNCIKENNYDFMHGILGIGLYYLKRNDDKALVYLNLIIDFLEKSSQHQDNKTKWIFNNSNDKPVYNICLSHGITSIVIFLCHLYSHRILKNNEERISNLLIGAINYILAQEIEKEKHGCYFPLMSLENGDTLFRTRLAWCYGDLGIAIGLFKAGKVLNNYKWQQKALEVFSYSTFRRNLRKNSVLDAGICHGTSGISTIFQWIYTETNDKEFLDTAKFWTSQTLNMAKFKDGLAGYRYFTFKNEIVWETSFNFLHGIAGIGLSLISSITPKSFSSWNEILLLRA